MTDPADIDRARAALDAVRAAGAVSDLAAVSSLRRLQRGWARDTYALAIVDPERRPHDLIVHVRPASAILDVDLAQEYRICARLADGPVPAPAVLALDASEDTPFGGPFLVAERLPGSRLEPHDPRSPKTPTTDPRTHPRTNPTTHPPTDPTTNLTTHPPTDPTTDPTSDPPTNPTTDPLTDPTSDPPTDPTTDPQTDPPTDPTTDPTSDPGIAADLADVLAAIHAVDAAQLQGAVVARDFAETLAYWHEVQTRVGLVRDPIVEEAYRWAAAQRPEEVPACLVHGDFRLPNCLIEDDRITGVVGWKLAFVGDPRFDLGCLSLAHRADPRLGASARAGASPGARADAEPLPGIDEARPKSSERGRIHDRYAQLTGQPVDREVVRTFAVVAALMQMAILHTGVRTFADGRIDDIRMAERRYAIPGLRRDLCRLIGWGES